jgi:hypothetical protein
MDVYTELVFGGAAASGAAPLQPAHRPPTSEKPCALPLLLLWALPAVVLPKRDSFGAKIVFFQKTIFPTAPVVPTAHAHTCRRSQKSEPKQEKGYVGRGGQAEARRRRAWALSTGSPPFFGCRECPLPRSATDTSPRPCTLLTMYYSTLGAGGGSRLCAVGSQGAYASKFDGQVIRNISAQWRPTGIPRPGKRQACVVVRRYTDLGDPE